MPIVLERVAEPGNLLLLSIAYLAIRLSGPKVQWYGLSQCHSLAQTYFVVAHDHANEFVGQRRPDGSSTRGRAHVRLSDATRDVRLSVRS